MTLLNDIKLCESRLEASRQAAVKQAEEWDIDPYRMQDANGVPIMAPILVGQANCYLARVMLESERRAKNPHH